MTKRTGHCLCGATSFEYDSAENWMGVTAISKAADGRPRRLSPAFLAYQTASGDGPALRQQHTIHQKSVTRSFCKSCGAPIACQTTRLPDEIHFYGAGPTDQSHYKPTAHFFSHEAAGWASAVDTLPQK
jgi:hypothetical protein